VQDPKVGRFVVMVTHTHKHTKSSVSCAVTQNFLNKVKTHHVPDMCFTKYQYIKKSSPT